MAQPTDWQPFVPGNPFYTPQRHRFGGDWSLNLTQSPCVDAPSECEVDVGVWMPDSRNDMFVKEGVASAFSVRLANQDVGWISVDGAGGVNAIGKMLLVIK